MLTQNCQVDGVLIGSRHQVVVHIGAHVRHLIEERQVVLFEIVLHKELIELISVRTGVERLVNIGENRFTQLVFTARGERHGAHGYKQQC